MKQENQRKVIGLEQAQQNAKAKVAGIKAQIAAEKEKIEKLRQKYSAEIVTPARLKKRKQILQAQGGGFTDESKSPG